MLFHTGVVGHTSRCAMATNLASQVEADHMNIDDGTLGCTGNHRAVLERLVRFDADYCVILEDDAQPIDNFRDQAARALASTPAPIVSFYLGTSHPRHCQPGIRNATARADHLGAAWITAPSLYHAVAYAIPTHLAADLLTTTSPLPIDDAITAWAHGQHLTVAYTWPSLVNHRDESTVITNRSARQPRKAWRTGTPDWSTRTVEIAGL